MFYSPLDSNDQPSHPAVSFQIIHTYVSIVTKLHVNIYVYIRICKCDLILENQQCYLNYS